MKVRCDYCDNYISDQDESCPYCGAPNRQYVREGTGVPRTIEELQKFCADRNMPLEKMRFFIGEDYRGARAFGIYQKPNTETFVVYKNKADGSRAIRYEGEDEAYAVNELYLKLKEETANQIARGNVRKIGASKTRMAGDTRSSAGTGKRKKGGCLSVLLVMLAIIIGVSAGTIPNRGYYKYQGAEYYYLDHWYLYDDDDDDWQLTTVPSELKKNYEEYYDSREYVDGADFSDFSDTYYYSDWEERQSSSNDDNDWDSSDYDYSDWDSGSTDWDSDW